MLDVSGQLGLIRKCFTHSYAKQEILLALQEFEETKFGLLEPSSGPTVVWRHALEGLHRIGVGARCRGRRGSLSPDHRSARWVREGRARRLVVVIVFADTTTQSVTPRLRS